LKTTKAVVLDIEGTTTPISFVYDILFPFARRHAARHLSDHWGSPEVRGDVEAFRAQAVLDAREGVAGVVAIPDGDGDEVRAAVVASVLWQMETDRKTTALKSLQGKVWRSGYASGQLKADVFDDVPEALRAWEARGVPVYIYSSGSVEAQKLLFAHTHYGDLRPLLSGYFDTTTGPKKVAASYVAIAEKVGSRPEDLLFFTDVAAEAVAAGEAGFEAVVMDRPGNRPQPAHGFEVWTDFTQETP